MGSNAEAQAANVQPPRRGQIFAVSVSATATAYNLGGLAMSGATPEASAARRNELYIAIQADGGAIYYYFHSATASDLDDTAKASVGGAVAYANTYGVLLPASAVHEIRIDRSRDKFLVLKTASGTAIARIWATSESIT